MKTKETLIKEGLFTKQTRVLHSSQQDFVCDSVVKNKDIVVKNSSLDCIMKDSEDWAVETLKDANLPPHALGVIVSSNGYWEEYPKNWAALSISEQEKMLMGKALSTSFALTKDKPFSCEHFAAQILFYAHGMREYIKENKASNAALCGINFQSTVMSALIKFGLEKHALKGKNNEIKGKARADKTNEKKTPKRRKEWVLWQQEVNLLRKRNPSQSNEQIFKKVGNKYNANSRTVRLRCK